MMFTGGWGSNKGRKRRARGIRKPKVRWEVLGLQNPLATPIEDIRQQVSRMANSWLEEGPLMTQGRRGDENG
jgi:hypothetical protein